MAAPNFPIDFHFSLYTAYSLRPLRTHVLISTHSPFNLLAPELIFLILAHPVYKMWIIQEPIMLELKNKLYFEEEKTESIYHD